MASKSKGEKLERKEKQENKKKQIERAKIEKIQSIQKREIQNSQKEKQKREIKIEKTQSIPKKYKQKESKTRVRKNKNLYIKEDNIKPRKNNIFTIILLIVSMLANILTIYHFITFNHNKVKIVTKIKEKEVVPENIVFLGDSLTYRYDLEKYYSENKNLVNSGIDGNTTEDILNNMKKRVYDYNPSKVFVLIGTNDIQKEKKDEEIIDNIKKIVEGIEENRPKAKIYLESIYPVDKNNEKEGAQKRENSKIQSINNKIENYCKAKKIEYINVYDKLLNEDKNLDKKYTKDGLHISEDGYKVITEILKKHMKNE